MQLSGGMGFPVQIPFGLPSNLSQSSKEAFTVLGNDMSFVFTERDLQEVN
jgi:hypothetical protein